MIISCPNCNTRYAVKAESLGDAGRRVKCARCAHVWFQIRPEEPDEILDFVEPPPTASEIPPYSNLPAMKAGQPSLAARLWYTAALCALLAISATAFVLGYPQKVVDVWPAAARVYMALNMPVPALGRGLAFDKVTVHVFNQEKATALLVSGTITNTLDTPVPVPTLHLLVRNENRQIALEWIDAAPLEILEPNQTVTFYTQQLTQNSNAKNLIVTFTPHAAPKHDS